MAKHITIRGSTAKGLSFGDNASSKGMRFAGDGGVPEYVGARAEVLRTPEGVLIRMIDYKGKTEEVVAEAIQDIITNPDGSLLFVLPDGRTILTDPLAIKDYDLLENKPSINQFTVEGDKTAADYRLQDKLDLITEQMIDNLFYGRT